MKFGLRARDGGFCLLFPVLLGVAFPHASGVLLRGNSNASSRAGYHCVIDLPTGEAKSAKFQKPYYAKLFEVLVDGNGKGLVGSRDNTFQEGFMRDHESEMRCLYALMLKDGCDGLQSRHDERQEEWELRCLDPDVRTKKIYELMSEKEMLYFNRLKRTVGDKAVFDTMLDWVGHKELACMQMKVVDDKCLGPFEGPRLLPDWYWETGVAPTKPPHVPKPNTGSKWFEAKKEMGLEGDSSSPGPSSNSTQGLLLANLSGLSNGTAAMSSLPIVSLNATLANATSAYQAIKMPHIFMNITTEHALKAPTRYFRHL